MERVMISGSGSDMDSDIVMTSDCPLIPGSNKKMDFVCNLHDILDGYLDCNLNSIVELLFIQCSKFQKY